MEVAHNVNSSFDDSIVINIIPVLNLTSNSHQFPLNNLTASDSLESPESESDIVFKISTLYFLTLLAYLVSHHLSKCPEFVKDLIKVITVNSTLLIVSPFFVFFYSLILLYRGVLTVYFRWILNDNIKLMDSTDVAWAFESHAQCNNFTSLYVLKGTCNVKSIRERILNKLIKVKDDNGNFIYQRLRYCAKKSFGFYCWQKHDNFNVAQHVRLIDGFTEEAEFSEKDIFTEISNRADEPMSSSLPQWEILIVPNFKYIKTTTIEQNDEKYYALVIRVHHSIMDGVSAGHILKYALADEPVALSVDPMKPPAIGFMLKLLMYLKVAVLGPANLLTSMTVDENNCFHKNPVTGPKHFDWSRPVSMKALKAIKSKTNTTTTAVLISSIGGAIRNLAVKKGLPVPGKILAGQTIAMLPYPDIRPRNRFVLMHYPLESGLASPVERLEAAHQTAIKLARAPDPLFNFTVIKICGRFPSFIADFLMGVLHATFIFSNVPGPSETAYLFGGHQLVDAAAFVPIKNWTGIGVCTFSYDGKIRAAFVSDKACLHDDNDVSLLVQGFEQEISVLAKDSGVEANDIFWTKSK